MAFEPTPTDISVIISIASEKGTSADRASSFAVEKRITPTWTVLLLKAKLETMTGVPPASQRLLLKAPGREDQWVDGDDRIIREWGLGKGYEIEVHDLRPASARPNFTDLSSVEKFEIGDAAYESLPNSVLAWKKSQKLGRFDPNALSPEELAKNQVQKDIKEIKNRNIELSKRAIILPSSPPHIRRGAIRFIGRVPGIPSPLSKSYPSTTPIPDELAPIWIGIELDEPTGKNDGSVGGERYFTCPDKRGAFVKPEKVEVGDFPPLGLDGLDDDDMEEI